MEPTASQQEHEQHEEHELPLPTHTLDSPNADVMAQFLARFDPLAMLEAEYAAVLAQSASSSKAAAAAATTASKSDGHGEPTSSSSDNQHDRGDNGDSSDDDDDGTRDDSYAQLPMSPTGNGEYYQPLGDDSDVDDTDGSDNDDSESDAAMPASDSARAPTLQIPQLDAATRRTVMQSMQRLTLEPPAWAKDASLSDDDLVALVQRQLQQQ